MNILQQKRYQITVTCLPGLEELLVTEVTNLGGESVVKRRRAVTCEGDLRVLYKLNIHCRFALRVLLHLEHHKIDSEDELYRAMYSIYWQKYFSVDHSFAIRCAFGRHQFKNTHYFALKAKDAVVDRFKAAVGRRPSIDTKKPDIGLHLYYDSGNLDIYLDSSGYSLHKRGYKRFLGLASISETMAAAMFRWADWKPGQPVINPMCGVGTIAIEAAYMMNGIPAQSHRDQFGFKHWDNFNQKMYDEVRAYKGPLEIYDVECADKDDRAVRECRENVHNAGLSDYIHCDTEDFFETEPVDNSIILLNPPYDKRLKESDVVAFYKKIGDTLKFKWKNCRCVVISANLDALKFIGLRPNKKYKVFNGPLPAEVRIYDIY